MHQFNEHHPELKGFSAYFSKEVQPFLETREEDRKVSLKKALTYCGMATGLPVVVGVFLFTKFGFANYIFFIIIFSAVGIAALYKYTLKDVSQFTKEQIVGGICSYIGWQFRAEPAPPNLQLWSSLLLIVSGYDANQRVSGRTTKFEDEISGQAHGALFKSVEVKLKRKSGDATITDFRGQLMSITFPRQFMGRTIVLRDKAALKPKKKSALKRVGLVDPVFERIFEAYGTDQVEARYLLTPTFMQRLVDLENSVDGKNIRFGFDGGILFIAVETKNRYEPGSMRKPLTEALRTQKILDEIGAIYDVIDGVMERPG